jgi:protease I
MKQILSGKKIAILVDTEYIHDEIQMHKEFFVVFGAKIDFISYLHGQEKRTIVSDVTEPDQKPHTMVIDKEFDQCNPNDYAIVIVAAN